MHLVLPLSFVMHTFIWFNNYCLGIIWILWNFSPIIWISKQQNMSSNSGFKINGNFFEVKLCILIHVLRAVYAKICDRVINYFRNRWIQHLFALREVILWYWIVELLMYIIFRNRRSHSIRSIKDMFDTLSYVPLNDVATWKKITEQIFRIQQIVECGR